MADVSDGDARETPASGDTRRWYAADTVLGMFHSLGLDISEPTFYRLVSDRRFPGLKLGRRIFLRRGPVDEFIAAALATNTLMDLATWEPSAETAEPCTDNGQDVA